MRRVIAGFTTLIVLSSTAGPIQDILVEAESFSKQSGWVVDSPFMDIMGK